MGRFLFAAWPYAGHINPCMSLAGRLRERGHAVAFYTGASSADTVASEGYQRFPFDSLASYLAELSGFEGKDDAALYRALNHRYTTITEASPLGKLRRIQQFLLEMTAGSIEAQTEDLRKVTTEWRPDVIISDPMMWAPLVVLHETAGLPVVPFSFYAGCLIPGPGLAPAGFGLPPATGLLSASRNVLASGLQRALTGRVREKINRMRRRERLPAMRASVHEHSGRMPLYLVASTREFDYLRTDLPASVEYAGPCLWERSGGAEPLELPASPEVIYVSEGTAQVGEPFLLRPALQALATENVQIVATTGLQRSADALEGGPRAANLIVRQWISQMSLFEKTSVVVTTGGSGTVRQALWFGVPILVAPLEWDQTENAQRLVNCGAGIRISVASCKSDVIGRLIRSLRTNPSFRENARRIGESFRRAAASNAVIERLESLVPVG